MNAKKSAAVKSNEEQKPNHKATLFPICVIQFIVHSSVYSVHEFFFKSLTDLTGDNQGQLLYLIQIIKFFVANIASSVAQNTSGHHKILMLGMLGFSLSVLGILAFMFIQPYVSKFFQIMFLIIDCVLYFGSLGIIFSLIDGYCINYAKNIDKFDKYTWVHMSSSFGHMFAMLPGIFIGKDSFISFTKRWPHDKILNLLSFSYGIISFLVIATYNIQFKKIQNSDDEKVVGEKIEKLEPEQRSKPYLSILLELLSGLYCPFILAIFVQGIIRELVHSFKRKLHELIDVKLSYANLIEISRTIFEIFLYFCLGKLRRPKYVYHFFTLCCFVSIARPLFIYSASTTDSQTIKNMKMLTAELSKSIFSAFFKYSSVRIADDLSTQNSKTVAQGLFPGVYAGFSVVPFVIIALSVYNTKFSGSESEVKLKKINRVFFIAIMLSIIGFIIAFFLSLLKRRSINR